MTGFKIRLKILESLDKTTEAMWYSALKNIYGIHSQNYDGYISRVQDQLNSLVIDCYTVEGPEEQERLSNLKNTVSEWDTYRKTAVTKAIISHARTLGYKYSEVELVPL